jgi:hypothetical protein
MTAFASAVWRRFSLPALSNEDKQTLARELTILASAFAVVFTVILTAQIASLPAYTSRWLTMISGINLACMAVLF